MSSPKLKKKLHKRSKQEICHYHPKNGCQKKIYAIREWHSFPKKETATKSHSKKKTRNFLTLSTQVKRTFQGRLQQCEPRRAGSRRTCWKPVSSLSCPFRAKIERLERVSLLLLFVEVPNQIDIFKNHTLLRMKKFTEQFFRN